VGRKREGDHGEGKRERGAEDGKVTWRSNSRGGGRGREEWGGWTKKKTMWKRGKGDRHPPSILKKCLVNVSTPSLNKRGGAIT